MKDELKLLGKSALMPLGLRAAAAAATDAAYDNNNIF